MITSDAFRNKQYAVLGLARSGLSAVETLAASGARIIAWDAREEAREAVADKAQVTDPMTTPPYGLDGIVVSPGVPLNRHPIAARAGSERVGDRRYRRSEEDNSEIQS